MESVFFIHLTSLIGAYFLITVHIRMRFRDSEPLTIKQTALFLTSMIILYVIKGSPLDLMGHLMFYPHAIAMVLLVLLIPPLFIFGYSTMAVEKCSKDKNYKITI